MPDQSKIDEAAARLQRMTDDMEEVGLLDTSLAADIRTVLDELRRLQAERDSVVTALADISTGLGTFQFLMRLAKDALPADWLECFERENAKRIGQRIIQETLEQP
jgi:uncharacterized protein YoxC